jgi:tetratricopeptide (TPR) repeat protein
MVSVGTATRGQSPQQKKTHVQHLLLVFPIGVVLLGHGTACRDSMRTCQAHFDRAEYEQAAAACARAAEDGDDDGHKGLAAALAAGAAYHLDRADEVRAWAERARGLRSEAEILSYLGRVQKKAGEHEAAHATHVQALDLAHRLDEPRGIARNAYRLALDAWNDDEYAQALALGYEALAAGERSGERDQQCDALGAIGVTLFDLGDLAGARLAQEHLRGLARPDDPARLARMTQQEGLVYEAEDRMALARDAFGRALDHARAASHARLQRDNLINLASVAISLGDAAAARAHLDAIQALDPKFDMRHLSLYQGRLARLEGDLDQAVRVLEQGRAFIDNPDWLWEIELELGHVAELRGDQAAAADAYGRAVGHVERMRASLETNELKAWALARKRRPYEALFTLHAQSGRPREALDALERARARSLIDAFLAGQPAGEPAQPPARAQGASTPDSALPPWLRDAAERAGILASLLPAMSTSPVAQPRPVDEILAALGERTALAYFRTADALWLLHVSRGQIALHQIATGEALRALEQRIETLVRSPGDAGAATALGQALLPAALRPASGAPGAPGVPGAALYIAADGPLMRLPFAVLRVDGRYLVEQHPLIYVPSLGALAAIESNARPRPGPPAALGDARGDLPEARREIVHVSRILGAAGRVQGEATVDALRAAAGARVLHLATHVEVGPRGATLILADGAVDAAQIVDWRLGPGLAVLAGCASAVQLAHRHGREMWGSLAAAFLASGARQVVAALWSIPDGPTRAFVEQFYAEGGADDPATALARVQRAWIASGRPADEWAPFVLVGTGQPGPAAPQ